MPAFINITDEVKVPDERAARILAQCYADRSDLHEALAWCRQAIAENRASAGHYLFYATLLLSLRRADQAAIVLHQALVLEPELVMAHYLLAIALRMSDATDESSAQYRLTLRLLTQYAPEDALPEGDGLTAGRLSAIVSAQLSDSRIRMPQHLQ